MDELLAAISSNTINRDWLGDKYPEPDLINLGNNWTIQLKSLSLDTGLNQLPIEYNWNVTTYTSTSLVSVDNVVEGSQELRRVVLKVSVSEANKSSSVVCGCNVCNVYSDDVTLFDKLLDTIMNRYVVKRRCCQVRVEHSEVYNCFISSVKFIIGLWLRHLSHKCIYNLI